MGTLHDKTVVQYHGPRSLRPRILLHVSALWSSSPCEPTTLVDSRSLHILLACIRLGTVGTTLLFLSLDPKLKTFYSLSLKFSRVSFHQVLLC
jgi:hypothetical protein